MYVSRTTLLAVATLLNCHTVCAGPPLPCFPEQEVILSENVIDAAVADVDGDGQLDAIGLLVSELVILRNDGGDFVPFDAFELDAYSVRVVAGDINQDGAPDLAVATKANLLLFLNTGTGFGSAPTNTIPIDDETTDLAFGDFDGDGDEDLVVAQYSPDQGEFVYLQPDATIEQRVPLLLDRRPEQLSVGDVNNDGRPDVAFLQFGGRVEIAVNDISGFQIKSIEVASYLYGIALVDVNSDARDDLVVVGDDVHVYLSEGMDFVAHQQIPIMDFPPSSYCVHPIHLDDDGDPDLLIGMQQLLNDGNGSFKKGLIRYPVGVQRTHLRDMDGNGRLDAVQVHDRRLVIVRDDAQELFDAAYTIEMTELGESLQVIDWNEDGKDDLLTTKDGDVIVRLGGSRDQFNFEVLVPGEDFTNPAAVDLNGDARLDLFAASLTGPHIFIQQPDGTFAPSPATFPPAHDGAFGDFNDDGRVDIVAIKRGLADEDVYLITNIDGNQYSVTDLGDFRRIEDVAAGDLNGDGFDDIAFAGEASSNTPDPSDWPWHVFGVLLSAGAGGFHTPQWMGDAESSLAIDLADFDNDGDIDAGVTYEGLYPSSHVLPFQNNGAGEFTRLDIPIGIGSGLHGYGVHFSDLDGDMLPDMIATLTYGTYIFRNVDGSSFEPWQEFPLYGYIRAPTVGDFDGDGLLDLACTTPFAELHSDPNQHVIFYGTCPAPCRGDSNGDGAINVFDLLELLRDWGVCIDCPTDMNRDGSVTEADLHELLMAWGSCSD